MDVDKLKQILAALEGTDVTRLTWVEGQETLDLRLGHPPPPTTAVHAVPVATGPMTAIPTPPAVAPVPAAATPAVEKAAAPAKTGGDRTFTVNSPFVGTFYRSASPENPPFVDVGTVVKKGQVLCIVEAMKLMNEIESDVDGTIVAVLAENGHAVEFGEPLFQIKP